jgi:sulfur carrier protein
MIRVNDRFEVEWFEGMTIETLLQQCGFTYPLVVVSVQGQVVPNSQFSAYVVEDGSDVRVLHLVAGG